MSSKSKISFHTVWQIFKVFRGSFGSVFLDRYRNGDLIEDGPYKGKDKGLMEATQVWAERLAGLSHEDIAHGLKQNYKRPPSADEFVAACCTRDYQSAYAQSFPKLAAPRLSKTETEQRLNALNRQAAALNFQPQYETRLDWAEAIADQVARGVYPGNVYCKRFAAEAFVQAHRPVPASLQEYLYRPSIQEEEAQP